MQRFLLLVVVSTILLSGCLVRNNYAEGMQSFKVQNYREAFIRLIPVAEKGNPEAQYAVGYMYYYGEGVIEDRKKACYWIELAAKAGQPDAIAALRLITPPPTTIAK